MSKVPVPIVSKARPALNDGSIMIFPLAGRLDHERERLLGMTDEEREYRKQYLKDQILDPDEPCFVPEERKEFMNPIRRFYRFPLDKMYDKLAPVIGNDRAYILRYFTGKFIMGIMFAYAATYYMKYCANDWTRKSGWKVLRSRPIVYPGDPTFPRPLDRTEPAEFYDRNFKNSPI